MLSLAVDLFLHARQAIPALIGDHAAIEFKCHDDGHDSQGQR